MSRIVLLDSGPLGLLGQSARFPQSIACNDWLAALLASGARVVVPEITGYEVRRELLRLRKTTSVARLDALGSRLEYLPITTDAMRQAAIFWAQARQQGRPTTGAEALDADVILAAQAVTLNLPNTVIATMNVGHLSRFVPADLWTNIR
jgi:predicted nucleic acid-binding protein